MINYEVIPPDWHDVGMGVTFQAMYRNAEAWTFSFAGRGGLLNVLSAQAELGFAYHTGYDKKPGGWGIHLGASLPLTLLLIDAGPTIKGFISMSDTVGSELMLGGEALFPSAILTLCGQGCNFN